jgi:hypothetical protein
MLTLARFRALAASYGADLRRWPEEARREARALLGGCPPARALLEQARALDEALAAASARERRTLVRPVEADAALGRLRARTMARIASSPAQPVDHRPRSVLARFARAVLAPRIHLIGLAAGGGAALIAGLLIGAIYTTAPAVDTLLPMLQPAPIQFLAEQEAP